MYTHACMEIFAESELCALYQRRSDFKQIYENPGVHGEDVHVCGRLRVPVLGTQYVAHKGC